MATSTVLPVVIGVDIGGTNTDAVLIHYKDGEPEVVSEVKEQTSSDLTSGLQRAVLRCLLQAKDKGLVVSPVRINIGTTHFINAVIQQRELARVAVIRLCGPVSHEIPPFCDFPEKLADLIKGPIFFAAGGCQYNGEEKESLNREQLQKIALEIVNQGITNIVIVGIFSPIQSDQEIKAGEIVRNTCPDVTITLSHEIGNTGLLERENATILNECLKPLCKKTISEFEAAFTSIGVTCPFRLTQNDGTIISSEEVIEYPVLTFASGATNSMRGAAFLSAQREAIVIDIGGTSSDVGALTKGFPRKSSTHIKVGGVKINVSMPDVVSIGLGGGSYVYEKRNDDSFDCVEIGPLSAGYNLEREALVFGSGEDSDKRSLTATDLAVFLEFCNLGSRTNVSHLDNKMVTAANEKMHIMLENLVDRIKLNKDPLPVIVVGGGSIIVDLKRPFRGASELIIPDHFGVANAIGAALSKISVTINTAVHLSDYVDQKVLDQVINDVRKEDLPKDEKDSKIEDAKKPFFKRAEDLVLDQCCERAISRAVEKGADKDSLEFLEKPENITSPNQNGTISMKVRVAGDLYERAYSNNSYMPWIELDGLQSILNQKDLDKTKQMFSSSGTNLSSDDRSDNLDATQNPKEPFTEASSGEWILSDWDIECIVVGAGLYGCGGGGSLHIARIRALKALRDGKRIRVISARKLLENADPDNDLVVAPGIMGSPTVLHEQGASILESKEAVDSLMNVYDSGVFVNYDTAAIEEDEEGSRYISNYTLLPEKENSKHRVIGFVSIECAGTNAVEPLLLAAEMNVPVIDADGMTRAFPKLQMYIPYMYGMSAYPASIVGPDYEKTKHVLLYSKKPSALENYLRNIAIANGCISQIAVSMNTTDVLNNNAPFVLSSAWHLGNAILRARLQKQPVIKVIEEQENGKHVISGKVVDIWRETHGGFDKGVLVIEGLDEWLGLKIQIEFQNEYLVIFSSKENGSFNEAIGCVPDLISVVEADTGEPIPSEGIHYGIRVAVLLIPSSELLRRPEALKWVGPQAFGYSEQVLFTPFRERHRPRSIPPI